METKHTYVRRRPIRCGRNISTKKPKRRNKLNYLAHRPVKKKVFEGLTEFILTHLDVVLTGL